MNNLIIKLGFASKWATTNAIGKVATMGFKPPCVATRVLRARDQTSALGVVKVNEEQGCCGQDEDGRCATDQGPVRADSAMQVDLSVELKDRSVDLYFCSNEWPL